MKDMDKGAAERIKQLGQGKNPSKVYSDKNIAKTERAVEKAAANENGIDKIKVKIDGKPMPKQDISEVLKAATEKNVADPMAMTQSGMGEIGKAVKKGRG